MKQNQKPKTKMIMKANIKLHPTIQEPLNKATEIFAGILIGLIIIGIAYLLIDTLFIPHPESPRPTQEEINKICDYKNMEAHGYSTETHPQGIFSKNHTTQTYITCKTPYPTKGSSPEYANPECCYPIECSQAKNNPKQCNCIYLTYCYQKSSVEQIEWYYKLSTK